jgi:hypothetical protein
MNDPRQVLMAYSENRAGQDEVMRALTEHTGWYVPAGFAVKALHTTNVESAFLFSQEYEADPSQLILFTDKVAAARASGHRLGCYASGFRGSKVFGALTDGFTKVLVNPCSPTSELWTFQREAFPLAQLWAQMVELETALEAAEHDQPLPYAQLEAFPGFMVLLDPDRCLHLVRTKSGTDYAVAFTSPDRFRASAQAQLPTATLGGASLFRTLANAKLGGLFINPGGDSWVIPNSEFAEVLR